MNYKQTAITGESWTRASRVLIENPLDDNSSIRFIEDRVINLGESGKFSTSAVSVLTERLTEENKSTSFDILDPETLESTGKVMLYKDVYQVLNSLYMHLAKQRDRKGN